MFTNSSPGVKDDLGKPVGMAVEVDHEHGPAAGQAPPALDQLRSGGAKHPKSPSTEHRVPNLTLSALEGTARSK